VQTIPERDSGQARERLFENTSAELGSSTLLKSEELAWPARPFKTFVDVLRYRATQCPDALAFEYLIEGDDEGLKTSYARLDQEARSIALALMQIASPGDRVLLLYPPCPEFLSAFFGCLYAGMLAVPAYLPKRNRHADRLAAVIHDAGAEVALTNLQNLSSLKSLAESDPTLKRLSWLASDSTLLPDATDWVAPPSVQSESIAFLQYTSGSTGSPKGVMVSHGNLLHNSSLIYATMAPRPESHYVNWLPTFHDFGLILGALQPIYGGYPCTMMSPNAFLQKPARWLRSISKTRADFTAAPNFAFDLCVSKITDEEKKGIDLSCLRRVYNAAEPVRKKTIESFSGVFAPLGFSRTSFYPSYGMAEATLFISGSPKEGELSFLSISKKAYENLNVETVSVEAEDQESLVGCGSFGGGQKVVIVNPNTKNRCASNEVGEIWVQGESVAQGYWNRPDASQEAFQGRIAESGEGPFLRTGDLGFIQQGQLYISGRHKDLIIIRGVNHFPQDIEKSVEELSKDFRAGCGAAFSIEEDGHEELVIVQELVRHPQASLETLAAQIRERVIQDHGLQIHTVSFIKTGTAYKTSSGKIQRRRCRSAFLEKTLDELARFKKIESASPSRESNQNHGR